MVRAKFYGDVLSSYIKAGSNCSPEVLAAMANSDIDRIRLRVAENPKTPTAVLEALSKDKNPDVRIAVGTNPSTPATVSCTLAFDDNPNVRLGLADDTNTPVELLEQLCTDDNPYISYRAEETLKIIGSNGKARRIGNSLLKWAGVDRTDLKYA